MKSLLLIALVFPLWATAKPSESLIEMGFKFDTIGAGPWRPVEVLYRGTVSGLDAESLVEAAPHLAKDKVEFLSLSDSPKLKSLDGIQRLKNLKYLFVSSCPQLETVSSLDRHPTLKLIVLRKLSITSVGWSQLLKLEHLAIRQCSEFKDLVDMKGLVRLRSLDLSMLPMLGKEKVKRQWQALTRLKKLELLELRDCPHLNQLQALKALPALRQVRLRGNAFASLSGLGALRQLERISLQDTEVEDCRELAHMHKLRAIQLSGNRSLKNIDALGKLAGLEQFECSSEEGASNINVLKGCQSLQRLRIPAKYATVELVGGLPKLSKILIVEAQKSLIEELKTVAPKTASVSAINQNQGHYDPNWIEFGTIK